MGFQILFHSPHRGSFHLSLTVLCAIGDILYLVLDDGAPGFPQGFSDPVVLGILLEPKQISPTGLSPTMAGFPKPFDYLFWSHIEVPQPHPEQVPDGLDCSPFARHYLGNLILISFPGGT